MLTIDKFPILLYRMLIQAYKFEPKISKTGQIKLPLDRFLFDKELEVIIVPKQVVKSTQLKTSGFLYKWSEFLTNSNTDDLKKKKQLRASTHNIATRKIKQ
ncbi:MAG: hypothetical protein ACOC4J_03030 [Bacteroidota bacterium]